MQTRKQMEAHSQQNHIQTGDVESREIELAGREHVHEKSKGMSHVHETGRNSDNVDPERDTVLHASFEDIFEQNERRIHYHIHKLNIRDPHNEFYVEGLRAMWTAYKKYRPDQGAMSTYFNFTIRNRLIDMLRKKNRDIHHEETYIQQQKPNLDNGNRDCKTNQPIPDRSGIEVTDDTFWQKVQELLTENQWKWVKFYVIEEMPLKEIAEQEGVTVEAVKSWRKTAKKRLENAGVREW